MAKYNMTFEEAQEYISKRGFDIAWNDCDVFIDVRHITQAIGNILKWADEHPKEEPVSEDLDEAAKEWLRPQLDKSYANYGEAKMMELTHFDGYAMLEAIEFGAKWEEEQFEKNRLEHCNSITNEQAEMEQKFVDQHLDKHNRIPTFLDAIEYGMEIGKKKPKSHKGKGVECAECADYWKKKGIEIGKKKK